MGHTAPLRLTAAALFCRALGCFPVWLLILWYLSSELDKYWLGEKPVNYSKKYRKKDIVDDVEYNVDEEEEDA